MKNFNAKGYEFRRYFQCLLTGAALILIHPAHAACDGDTIDCQNTTIKNLKQQIELLEMDKSGIHVAEYLTELPPKELLEQRFRQALKNAKGRIDYDDNGSDAL